MKALLSYNESNTRRSKFQRKTGLQELLKSSAGYRFQPASYQLCTGVSQGMSRLMRLPWMFSATEIISKICNRRTKTKMQFPKCLFLIKQIGIGNPIKKAPSPALKKTSLEKACPRNKRQLMFYITL